MDSLRGWPDKSSQLASVKPVVSTSSVSPSHFANRVLAASKTVLGLREGSTKHGLEYGSMSELAAGTAV